VGSLNLTSTENDTLFFTAVRTTSQFSSFTHGAGQTELSENSTGMGSNSTFATSFEVRGLAGTETLTSTSSNTTNLTYVAIGIKPSEEAPPEPEVTRRRRPALSFR
jgi:hypothetical protein